MILEAVLWTVALPQGIRGVRRVEEKEMFAMSPYTSCISTNVGAVSLAASMNVEECIEADLGTVPGVSGVTAERKADSLCVSVYMDRFEPESRHRVYSKEFEIINAFPEFEFDFRVIAVATA